MYYVIIGQDKVDSLALRLQSRSAHLERINELLAAGRLLIAGPNPAIDSEDPGPAGFTGSIIIAEFSSLSEAQQWASEDPYRKAGVYESVVVKPFKKVLP